MAATPSLLDQLGALFLKDEKTAVLPDVVALFTYVSQNGVTLAGLAQLRKALAAVEADGITGIQQFLKDASGVIIAQINTATAPTPAPAPAPAA